MTNKACVGILTDSQNFATDPTRKADSFAAGGQPRSAEFGDQVLDMFKRMIAAGLRVSPEDLQFVEVARAIQRDS